LEVQLVKIQAMMKDDETKLLKMNDRIMDDGLKLEKERGL